LRSLKRLHWLDWLLIFALVATIGFVWHRIDGTLNYTWRWHIIPNFIIRFDEESGRWVSNLLLQGVITTIRISIYASVLALVLGVILGIARCSSHLAVRMLARTYLEVLRNIPPVVVIFIFFFFLSEQLVTAFAIEDWARAIARQDKAAQSIGLNKVDQLRFIVLPQALRKVVPPMANQFISLIKDSSIISLISVQELTFKTVEVVASTRAIFEAWITTAVFYFIICFGLSLLFRKLEHTDEPK